MKSIARMTAIAALSIVAAGAFASGPKPSASELVTQINAIQIPTPDQSKQKDPDYRNQFLADRAKAFSDKNKLILELYQDYPDAPEVPGLLQQRWQTIFMSGFSKDAVTAAIQETAGVVASNASATLKATASYFESTFKIDQAEMSGDDKNAGKNILAAAHDFTTAYPTDARGADLLVQATYATDDALAEADIDREILKDYPTSRAAGFAKGGVRRAEAIGKPFDLSFKDAVTGKPVSIPDLKGKVVVLDFWATWCGPCVGEMPHMKELYAKYHDKGLEVIGVSLDQPEAKGGLTSLKDFVAKNQIPWLQYYQGNYWQSEFSSSWGINSIPRTFILDKAGNLADPNGGRGEVLDAKVAKLLSN